MAMMMLIHKCFTVSCSTKGNMEYTMMEVECPPNCVKNYVHVADQKNGVYSVNSSVCAAAYREKITGTHHVDNRRIAEIRAAS